MSNMRLDTESRIWQEELGKLETQLRVWHKEMGYELTSDLADDCFHELVYIRMLLDSATNNLRHVVYQLEKLRK